MTRNAIRLADRLAKPPMHIAKIDNEDVRSEQNALLVIDQVKSWASRWNTWQTVTLNSLESALDDKDMDEVRALIGELQANSAAQFEDLETAIAALSDLRE